MNNIQRKLSAKCIKYFFIVTLNETEIDGVIMQCVVDDTAMDSRISKQAQLTVVGCEVLELHCISGSEAWGVIKHAYNWSDSGRDVAYFKLVSRDSVPFMLEDDQRVLGVVNTTSSSLCSKLCLKVRSCVAFSTSFHQQDERRLKECNMYNAVIEPEQAKTGYRYYSMQQNRSG